MDPLSLALSIALSAATASAGYAVGRLVGNDREIALTASRLEKQGEAIERLEACALRDEKTVKALTARLETFAQVGQLEAVEHKHRHVITELQLQEAAIKAQEESAGTMRERLDGLQQTVRTLSVDLWNEMSEKVGEQVKLEVPIALRAQRKADADSDAEAPPAAVDQEVRDWISREIQPRLLQLQGAGGDSQTLRAAVLELERRQQQLETALMEVAIAQDNGTPTGFYRPAPGASPAPEPAAAISPAAPQEPPPVQVVDPWAATRGPAVDLQERMEAMARAMANLGNGANRL